MHKLSIKIYKKQRERAELVMKTDQITMRIKNLELPMDFKNKMKMLGAALESEARIQVLFTLRNNLGGVWLLDCDARTAEARLQLWRTDFIWYGTLAVLKRAIRLL